MLNQVQPFTNFKYLNPSLGTNVNFRSFCSIAHGTARVDPDKMKKFASRRVSHGDKTQPPQFTNTKPSNTYVPDSLLQERLRKQNEQPKDFWDLDALEDSTRLVGTGEGEGPKGGAVFVPEPRYQKIVQFPDGSWYASASGSRKRSKAVIRIQPGTGRIVINNRSFLDYFPIPYAREKVLEPLLVTEKLGKFDITAFVKGGGVLGQAGAIRHSLSNALQNTDPALRPVLKKGTTTFIANINLLL